MIFREKRKKNLINSACNDLVSRFTNPTETQWTLKTTKSTLGCWITQNLSKNEGDWESQVLLNQMIPIRSLLKLYLDKENHFGPVQKPTRRGYPGKGLWEITSPKCSILNQQKNVLLCLTCWEKKCFEITSCITCSTCKMIYMLKYPCQKIYI